MIVRVLEVVVALRAPGVEIVATFAQFSRGLLGRLPITRPRLNRGARFRVAYNDLHGPADERLQFRQVQRFGIDGLANTNGSHGVALRGCALLYPFARI